MKNTFKLLSTVIVCELVGLISTPFTISSIPTWYASLNKPFFSPPNWIFGLVWTILYFLMGVSLYLILIRGSKNDRIRHALIYFTLQLMLNFAWSFIFFGLRSPLFAFIEILLLWGTILITMLKFYELSKKAGLLLLPYVVWVSFATLLNFSIVVLNR